MSKTSQCFRDGKWHVDELANLCEKFERELNEYKSKPIPLNFTFCARCGQQMNPIFDASKPRKDAVVPKYDYLTEGFDPDKLPKKI